MEDIGHMGKNSLEALARSNISEAGKRRLSVDLTTGIAGLCLLVCGLVFSRVFPDEPDIPVILYTVGFLTEGIPVFLEAFRGIVTRNLTHAMEILVAIAISACFFSGQYIPALLIPVILNISHLLEERSIMGGREALDGLRNMQTATALLLREDGSAESVDARTLEPGQTVLVKPGSGIPADGVVISGESNIDQKSLTGEPEPFPVKAGDPVYAGTVNLDGTLRVSVQKKFGDTSFSGIIAMLEEAERISLPESRLVDRFMKYYIPLVLAIAAAVALIEKDLSRAIAILVVSCPCGQMLVTSAPMVAALSAATKKGILIRNSKFIEEISGADTVVFDKTGTLTVGEMTVTGLLPLPGITGEELSLAARTVSAGSAHPVCKAVSALGPVPHAELTIKETPGRGMTGTASDGTVLRFGRREWIEESTGTAVPADLAADAAGSVSWVSRGRTVLGALVLGDVPRSDAAEAVEALGRLGVSKTVMLTGDRHEAAQRVMEATGVQEMYSDLLPEDKLRCLRELKKTGCVIAVGDGINDAPALREAHVGIAMGAMGSDLAIQSADIALMNNRLSNIPYTLLLARSSRRVIYENLALSIAVSAVMITLSAFGIIGALPGAFLHNIGAFAVILNSSRILRLELPASTSPDTEE